MDNWTIVALEDVLDYEQPTKYIVETVDYDDSYKTPVLTAGKSFVLGYTNEEKGIYDKIPAIIFDDFTTAFHYVDFPFKVKSSAMKILKANEKKADLRFLYYRMGKISLDTQLHKRYWISKFAKVKIPLPSLEVQKYIAQILDDAVTLRDKTEQLLKEYDLLAQSIFLNMFGDPVLNEKKWGFKALNDLIMQKPDNGFFAKNDFYGNTGTPVVWISDFINKTYVEIDNLKRAKTTEKDLKYSLKYGDALFCRSSLTVEGIGKCAIVPKTLNEDIIFECHIIRLKFNIEKVIPEFFRFLSDTAYFRNNVMKSSKTSTMTTISQDGISKIKIPVPPIELQNQFAEKIVLIEKQKELAKHELKESEDLFNCLLQKAFKGELV